jgi:succinate dehydrogenase/fumarate reductase flavoprotein subunit
MAQPRILVIGGGLAGLAATMRLAELGVHVDLISLVPVKRSHSVCAQGGINSVNALTRQQGDNEWKHFDDTVYGGDFLQHQPPVKEMADWGPRIVDLMDRGLSRPATVWRHTLQTDQFRRGHDRPATPLRPRRAGSSARGRGAGQEARVLGFPGACA